jgi:hypothetical protein
MRAMRCLQIDDQGAALSRSRMRAPVFFRDASITLKRNRRGRRDESGFPDVSDMPRQAGFRYCKVAPNCRPALPVQRLSGFSTPFAHTQSHAERWHKH